jgi:endonuclease/exonuclease/phosphatase family metal-dependent hydrolase
MDLRIASYNVRCFPYPFSDTDISGITTWITQTADIAALQEVWCRFPEWSAAFKAAGWTFLRPLREGHIVSALGSGLAVAFRTSDWSVADFRLYPYLSAVGLDALATKGWFRVELRSARSGKPFRLITTHMQSDYEICDELWRPIAEPVRMAQAFQLAETERRLPKVPTLLLGDWNTELCWLPEGRWLTKHSGPTFPGTNQVLDHCAAWADQPWVLKDHRVYRIGFSDHWPVVWTF